jgi:alpha(1,3/1,4) fucosyltransferase
VTIRVEFRDFWGSRWGAEDSEQGLILRTLEQFDDVAVAAPGNLLVFSESGRSNRGFVGTKLFVTPEATVPDFTHADYALTARFVPDRRAFRLPQYAHALPPDLRPEPESAVRDELAQKRREFCCTVVSNPNQPVRDAFLRLLGRLRPVASLGGHLRTSEELGPWNPATWRAEKVAALSRYKFVLCFENRCAPGYTTEKIVDAFAAGAVPVYWGNPYVDLDFNPERIVDVHRLGMAGAISRMLEVDADDDLYVRMRSAPLYPLGAGEPPGLDGFAAFLGGVVADLEPTRRRRVRALKERLVSR